MSASSFTVKDMIYRQNMMYRSGILSAVIASICAGLFFRETTSDTRLNSLLIIFSIWIKWALFEVE